jgi:PAS domain S-box-containing protein
MLRACRTRHAEILNPVKMLMGVNNPVSSAILAEGARLEALRRYYVLDTPPEAALDRITRLTARLFDAPMSLITLIDEKRQWIKSSFGLDMREIPREHAFCAHTIQTDEVMVVPDALKDERFRQNPLVVAHPEIRFYAGAPLRTPDGYHLGTLCVMDRTPRPPLTREQRELLSSLAATVMDELELRRSIIKEGQITALSDSLQFSDTALRAVLDTLPVGVWIADRNGQLLLSNRASREIWGEARYVGLEGYGEYKAWWPGNGRRLEGSEWGLARALRGETAIREELEIEAFDGKRKVILNSAVPIRDRDGNIAGAVAVNEDITSQKTYEQELLRREKQLEILTRASRQINQVLEIGSILRKLVESALQLVNARGGAAGLLENGRMAFTEYRRDGRITPIHYEFARGEGVPGWIIETEKAYISNDAEHDPHVIQEIRAALGFKQLIDVPISNRSGGLIGCFEIHDTAEGRPFGERDAEMLGGLAAAAAVALENARMLEQHAAADEALRESEERYRRLVEASPTAIALHSEGRIVYMNPAALKTVGAAGPEDVIGRPAMDFVHPDSRAKARERIERLAREGGESPLTGETFLRLDGTPIAVEVVSIALVYQGKPAVQAVFRDISERLRGEEALRSSEAQFRAVFEGAEDAMFILDDEWRHVDCNPAAARMFGRSPEQMAGYPLGSFTHPEMREEMLAAVKTAARVAPHKGSLRFVGSDGRIVEVEFTVRADFLPGRHLLIVRDITERLRLEAQLLQAQKMEAVGRLAGGVAHDFNNLLTIISGYSQLALDQLSELDPVREGMLEINRAGERAAGLTRQLLAFSRKQVLKPEIVNLNAIVADTEKMLRRLIGEDIELVTRLAPKLAEVQVDAGQIEQVIINLAVNARDAMPEGGRLVIETAEADLEEKAEGSGLDLPSGRYVTLSVTDTGAGMDAGTMSHIFEPFFTTKEQGKGTGLGLSTVYGIVKQSGGDIRVSSEPGRGASFTIYLPAARKGGAASTREAAAPADRGTETVLLVEDEFGVRDLVARILKSAGYRVLPAANGGEALMICERFAGPIHLLVTDIIMPGMSGRELAGRLESMRPGLRVLYISGYTGHAMKQGAQFIQKPFTPRALTRKVREVLTSAQGKQ